MITYSRVRAGGRGERGPWGPGNRDQAADQDVVPEYTW